MLQTDLFSCNGLRQRALFRITTTKSQHYCSRFVRGLLLSEIYRGYIQCNSNKRLAKQVIGRVLGRYSYNDDELTSCSILIASKGFAYFVDTLLNSDEYIVDLDMTVCHFKSRVLPGRSTGSTPINKVLPRYSDDWKQTLINRKMLMSISDHARFNQNKTKIASLIYEKPKGKSLIAWIAGFQRVVA